MGGVRGGGVSAACGSVSHGRGRSARPRPCPAGGGPDGQAGGVRFPVPAGGFSGPAVLFRTLPVTPVATRVWLSQTAGSFLVTSRCCADFRPYLEGGALPRAAYHPLAVRPANGYPSPALSLAHRHAPRGRLRLVPSYKHCPSGEDWVWHPPDPPPGGWPGPGGVPGGVRKSGPNCPDWESY